MTMDANIAHLLGVPAPKEAPSPDAPPAWMDEADAAEGASANGKSNVVRISARERQRDEDRARIVWGDGLATEIEEASVVCDGFPIAPGRPNILCGEGGTKKSFLAQYFLICAALGRKFLGRFDVRQGPTLFMDFEQGLRLTKKRLQRFARGMDFTLSDHRDRIAYVERPFYFDDIDKASVRLADLVKGFMLVAVDSAFRSAPRLRQNEAEAAIPFEIMTRASLETGTTFIGVDHASTKREEGARRKSMQSGNHHKLDGSGTVFMLSCEKGKPVLVTCEREQQEGEFPDDFAFDVEDVLDPACALMPGPYAKSERKWGLRIKEFGTEATEPAPRARKSEPKDSDEGLLQIAYRMLEAIKGRPGITSGELEELMKLRTKRFAGALQILVRDEKIENRTGKKTNTQWVAK